MRRRDCLSILALCTAAPVYAGVPEIEAVTAADVSPQALSLVYSVSEASSVEVEVFTDSSGARPLTTALVSTSPFRSTSVATAAADRGLGWVQVRGLEAATPYYLQLTFTSESTSQTATWPEEGLLAVTTATRVEPSSLGFLVTGALIRQPIGASGSETDGKLALLEVDGASAPLSAFVGDRSTGGSAVFDLSNLFASVTGLSLVPASGTDAVLTVYSDHDTLSRRGYRLPASGLEVGVAALEPYEQTLSFNEGWNYFSLWVEPDDATVTAVLADVWSDVLELWCYGASGWQAYDGTSAGLTDFTPLQGCAVRVGDDVGLTVEGPRPLDDLSLAAGWNVVAFPVEAAETIASDLATQLGDNLLAVWHYDAAGARWDGWEATLPEAFNALSQVEPGAAYYVSLNTAATLEVN